MRQTFRQLVLVSVIAMPFLAGRHLDASEEDLARRATWVVPAATDIQTVIEQWLAAGNFESGRVEQVRALWQATDGLDSTMILDRIVQSASLLDPRAQQLAEVLRLTSPQDIAVDPGLFEDASIPAPIRNNLRLSYGIYLAKLRLYDESQAELASLAPDQVADPAALLFYKGATHYRLREKEAGLATLEKLLEREETIPVRFATVARMMYSELKEFKIDSLDEVARLMDSIHVRLDHGRAGKRVRNEGDEVVNKLDKMIKKLEEQRQQQQQQMAAGKQGGRPNGAPMQDSTLPELQKPGDVERRAIDGPIDWGNLPPAERREALQRLGEEFPSHYREVIEEYFRDLSRKETDNP